MSREDRSVKRRWLIISGIGALIAAVAGFALSRLKPKPEVEIAVRKVGRIPRRDPFSDIWDDLPSYEVNLIKQRIVIPMKTTEPVNLISLKAAHDGEWIGFRLEWSDERADYSVVKVREFRDACAVMLLNYPVSGLAWRMGTLAEKATILQWRADWQYDIEKGFRDLEDAFPNVSVDAYPFMGIEGTIDGKPKKSMDLAAKRKLWFVGSEIGNIYSEFKRNSPVEKLLGIGPGSLTSLPTQDADGWGIWKEGKWNVVISKKLLASDSGEGELTLRPGNKYSIAFAVWKGSVGDRGSRKCISSMLTMYVEE